MKIVAKDTGGTGLADITLGDESQTDIILDPPPLPVEKRKVQVTGLASAGAVSRVFAKFLGNAQTDFKWKVERYHASQTTAQSFLWSHAASVPGQCSLTVYDDGGTPHFFSSAIIVEVAPLEWTNVKTVFQYSVVAAVPAAPL